MSDGPNVSICKSKLNHKKLSPKELVIAIMQQAESGDLTPHATFENENAKC